MTSRRDLNRPKYARCDSCGRNAHKVAVRLAPEVLAKYREGAERRARLGGYKPIPVHPVEGYCPSCAAGREFDPALVVYDHRAVDTRRRVG